MYIDLSMRMKKTEAIVIVFCNGTIESDASDAFKLRRPYHEFHIYMTPDF